jgi:hypothetical protein
MAAKKDSMVYVFFTPTWSFVNGLVVHEAELKMFLKQPQNGTCVHSWKKKNIKDMSTDLDLFFVEQLVKCASTNEQSWCTCKPKNLASLLIPKLYVSIPDADHKQFTWYPRRTQN